MVRIITLGAALLVLVASVATGVGTAGSNGLVASATGSGQTTFSDEQRTFTFTARKYADGSVKGEVQLNNRAQDRVFHMTLDCLVVNGNKAYASGVVDRSTISTDVGLTWTFEVVDNGEGANAPGDQISLVTIFSPQLPCTNPGAQGYLDTHLLPIESGNVQVH
jgi:hypothetical protein